MMCACTVYAECILPLWLLPHNCITRMLVPCLKVRVECQSLRDRLKVLQDTQQHDMGALEDRIAELQLQLDEVGEIVDLPCITYLFFNWQCKMEER